MIKTVTVWSTQRDELGVLYKAGQFRFPTRRDSEGLAQDFEMKDGITMFLRDTKMPLKNNCLLLRGLSKRPKGDRQHFSNNEIHWVLYTKFLFFFFLFIVLVDEYINYIAYLFGFYCV